MRRLELFGTTMLTATLVATLQPSLAHAEADTFGLGDGHSGAKVVSANENINTYAPLVADSAVGATTLQVGTPIANETTSPAPFAAGDLILVWRATGVAASAAPSGNRNRLALADAASTTSTNANEVGKVGLYEFARVQSVADGVLTVRAPMVNGFVRGVTQVIRVPEYTTVDVAANASLRATAWQQAGTQGWAGGMLIFMATGAVTNQGLIHANARGFHGGLPPPRLLNLSLLCNANDGLPNNGYAEKGEGVVQSQYRPDFGGIPNVANAGGGGACIEAGGGGGANAGNGGTGGHSVGGLLGAVGGRGGLGGVGLDYSLLQRITMGGGGGAGEQKDGQASSGGFGGGAIVVRAASMAGSGRVEANGGTAQNSGLLGLPEFVESDGAGGGGAGGSILLRFAGNADCDGLGGRGGDGGNARVLGLNILGPGGGGGSGRVLVQANEVTPDCDIDVTPGNPGNGGSGGSGGGTPPPGGNPGGNDPPPTGPFCVDDAGCPASSPICDVAAGVCRGCAGAFGSGDALACAVARQPVCDVGTCKACTTDFGVGGVSCQLAGAPYCFASGAQQGACGKCTTNAECTGAAHAGPICHQASGACGASCNADTDCNADQWCAPQAGGGVCIGKVPNGQPLPDVPPIEGECTPANGTRACVSAVCETDDDRCGKKNSSPCGGVDECRSGVCFTDQQCGKPLDEPCGQAAECRSNVCTGGVCVLCADDTACASGEFCDSAGSCQPIPGNGSSSGNVGDGGTSSGDAGGGSSGGASSSGGGSSGDALGIETLGGGGCGCEVAGSSSSARFGLGAAALGALVIRLRRRKR